VQLLDSPSLREILRMSPHLTNYLKDEKLPLFFSNALILGNF
jgi:hypothetical protein